MVNALIPRRLEYAVNEVCKQVVAKAQNVSWQTSDEKSLWHELVACILGSRVQYEQSQAAASYLILNGLLDVEHLKQNSQKFEVDIAYALEQPIFPPITKLGGRKYRYPKLRANYIRRTAEKIYLQDNSIRNILLSCQDEKDARSKIMSIAFGVGPKQASLFLRNIGYAQNLAILDTHILKYMSVVGLLPQLVQNVPSLHKYENIEQILWSYAEKFKVSLAYIDTAIWVVMRTCLKENIII